jgi:hypothetical protein
MPSTRYYCPWFSRKFLTDKMQSHEVDEILHLSLCFSQRFRFLCNLQFIYNRRFLRMLQDKNILFLILLFTHLCVAFLRVPLKYHYQAKESWGFQERLARGEKNELLNSWGPDTQQTIQGYHKSPHRQPLQVSQQSGISVVRREFTLAGRCNSFLWLQRFHRLSITVNSCNALDLNATSDGAISCMSDGHM